MLSFRILILLTVAVLAGTSATARASANESAEDQPAEDQGEREVGCPADAGFGDEITVRAQPLEQIETRTLEAERAALPILEASAPDQLGRFPDRDAAGAAQRLPGVTVLHEQGDARLVLIRGFLPSFNSATLDGERIPAGEADERAVALDLVPTELLESVQLTKTLTPDLDGDAIGGTIDLVTRRPPRGGRHEVSGSLGTGHDDGSDGARGVATLSWGQWLEGPEMGVRLSASRVDADRGVDSVENEWDDEELAQVRRQDHEVERSRQGAAASFEWLPGPTSSVRVRGLWSEFDDLERRRASVLRLEEGGRASELKDRLESQSIESVTISGERRAGRWLVEPRLSWNRGQESDPDRLDTIFVLETLEENSDQGEPSPVDSDDFVLEGFRTESDRSENEDLVAALDVSRAGPSGRSTWRAGAKWRHKRLWRDQNLLSFELDDDESPIRLSELVGAGWTPRDPFFGRPEFDLGSFPDPGLARSLFDRLGLEGERDPEEDVGDFSAEEDVAALYGLAEWAASDSISWVAGVRYESTEARYAASEIVLGADDEIETAPVRGGGSYGELLPSAVLRAVLGDRDVLRVAMGRSLARPNLEDLAPSQLVIAEDEEIIVGNPELRPTTSWNFDIQWERRLEPLGSLSLSAYAKDLSDVVALVRLPGETDAGGIASFTTVQPRNAGTASVVGLELSYQNRLRNGPLRGLGLLANVSWSDATAELEGRPSQSLPGQAERSASAVLSYERARISARLLYSYRGEILEELGESPSLDLYLEDRSQLDLSIQVQTTRNWAVFLEAFNLTQESVRQYEGSPFRPVFDERIGWWASVGLRFDL